MINTNSNPLLPDAVVDIDAMRKQAKIFKKPVFDIKEALMRLQLTLNVGKFTINGCQSKYLIVGTDPLRDKVYCNNKTEVEIILKRKIAKLNNQAV